MDAQTVVLNVRSILRTPLSDFLIALDEHYANDQENGNYALLRHSISDSLRNTLTGMGDHIDPEHGVAKEYGIKLGRDATVGRLNYNIKDLQDDRSMPHEVKQPLIDALIRAVGIIDAHCAQVQAASQGATR